MVSRLVLTISLACALGCDAYTGSTAGENGLINFYEPNTYPDDESLDAQGFELPVAVGARVDVWMTSPGVSSFAGAEIDNPDIINIQSQIYPIILRANSTGTARLAASQSDGVSDTLPLTVRTADGARVWIPTDDPFFGPPDSFFGTGYALRPGATITIAGQPTVGGSPMLGFDVLDWSIDPRLLDHRADATVVNTRRLEALGSSGVTTITTQLGGDVEIATLSEQDAPSLVLHSIPADFGVLVETSAIAPTDVAQFALTGNDADGRYVLPNRTDRAAFTATIVSGDVVLLDANLSGNFAALRACAGTGTVELSYLGARRVVPIEVTAEVADDACP